MSRRRTSIFIVVVVLACLIQPMTNAQATQMEDKAHVVRIGYIDYNGFIERQQDGTYTGYGVEYLNEIAKSTGWTYEYTYGTFEGQLKALEEGRIDFLCHCQKSKAREEKYIFSQYAVGNESSVLYVSNNDTNYYYNDYNTYNGMTVGFLQGSYQNDDFKEFAKTNGFTYKAAYFQTEKQAFQALDNKQLDGVAMGSLAYKSNYKIVAEFDSTPFYFMSRKGNTNQMKQLNGALSEIKSRNPYYEQMLYKKYYSESAVNSNMALTREEAEYIKNSKPVKLAFVPNRTSISMEAENGQAIGIVPEIIDSICKKTGLQFEYSFMPAGINAQNYIAENTDTIVAGVMTDNSAFHNGEYLVSDSFYESNIILVCRTNEKPSNMSERESIKLAVPKSYQALQSYIKLNYPKFEVVPYTTTEDCMKSVLAGEADFLAQNINIMTPLLMNPHYEELTALPTFFMNERLSILCGKSEDNNVLMSIINKAIATISEKDIEQITINNTLINTYKLTAKDALYKYRTPITVIGVLIVLCIMMLFANTQNKKRHYKAITVKTHS